MKNCESCLKIDGWVMVPRPGNKESSREMIVGGKMGRPALQGLACACHAPSWLDLGELSHTCIHLTTDHDSTQLNAPPCMGNTEYSPTRTSPTSMDISGQAGTVC